MSDIAENDHENSSLSSFTKKDKTYAVDTSNVEDEEESDVDDRKRKSTAIFGDDDDDEDDEEEDNDDHDEDDGEINDSLEESKNIKSSKPKKKLKPNSSELSNIVKYFDSEAQESEDEDEIEKDNKGTKTNKLIKKSKNSNSNIKKKGEDAGGNDSDDDEESEEEEDDNNYKLDDFVVAENALDSDDDSDRGVLSSKKTEKRQLSRLKKRKDDFVLDEDDYLLIEDNRKDSNIKSGKSSSTAGGANKNNDGDVDYGDDDDDNVIAPMKIAKKTKIPRRSDDEDDVGGDHGDNNDDDDDDDDEDGNDDMDDEQDDDDDDDEPLEDEDGNDGRNFLDDEGKGNKNKLGGISKRTDSSTREGQSRKSPIKYVSYHGLNGPSIDQIQDAREIFGDGFDFDDLDEDDEDELDIDDEEEDNDYDDTLNEEGETSLRKKKSQLSKEEMILLNLRKRFDRSQLVANFCTSKDDDIRAMDRPERYQDILIRHSDPGTEKRSMEALWISNLLVKKIIEKNDYSNISAYELQESVNITLKFIQVDNLEIPFIFTYRRDYLHPIIERKHLWFILTCDEKWEQLSSAKDTLMKTISSIQEASLRSQTDINAEKKRHANKIRNILDEIESLTIDVKNARNEEIDAKEIIDGNMDDTEEIKAEDARRLEQATVRHHDLVNQLKTKQIELSQARIEGDELTRKASLNLKYHPTVAVEVLRLFPPERYIPIIENTQEEVEVKDIAQFLDLIIKGAQGLVTGSKESDDMSHKQASQEEKSNSHSKKSSGSKDKYSKLFQFSPNLREFIECISRPVCDIGDSLRHGISSHPPQCPAIRLDVKAMEYVRESEIADELFGGTTVVSLLQNEKQVLAAVELILTTELSHEPTIKQQSRMIYRERASISTRPTKKGLLTINPFSEIFGLHFLDRKPISDFYDNRADRTLFIRLWEAQSQGLITITINPPSGLMSTNSKSELFIQVLKLRSIFQPTEAVVDDLYPHVRESWDHFRENILDSLYQKLMIPMFENEVRRDLMRIGRETIIEEAGDNFTDKMLSIGPYRPITDVKTDLSKLLLSCPRRPYYGSVMTVFTMPKEPLYFSYIDRNGTLRGHDLLPVKAMNDRRQKLSDFMAQYKPETIVINASGGIVSKGLFALIEKELIREVQQVLKEKQVAKNLERKRRIMELDDDYDDARYDDEDNDEDTEPYTANVCMVHDDVALIYQQSPRAKKQFPELQPGAAAAVCLGRFIQEPLAEYCNMFWLADATEVFGYELLYLDIHPYKSLLRGIRIPLIRELERRLVDAVNDVGVDLNMAVSYDHLAGMLGFVCGLGLRKADALRNSIRRAYSFIESRKDLLVHKLMGPGVYNNAIGFLRIRSENYDVDTSQDEDMDGRRKALFDRDDDDFRRNRQLNPLDNTRIHPECYVTYDFVQKLCTDALDKEFQPHDYIDIIIEACKASKTKLMAMTKTKWLELWKDYSRPTQKIYEDDFMNKQTQEIVKRTYPVELRDKLQLLDLDEYLEDLEKAGKGKRRLQLEAIKEELRYPWLDLRIPIATMPTPIELFKIITNETDYSLHVGLKIGCVVTEIIDQSVQNNRVGSSAFKRIQKALVKTDIGMKGNISAYEILDNRKWDSERDNIRDHFFVGKQFVAVVIGVNKEKMILDLSIKPSYVNRSETWWIKNRFQDPAVEWFKQSTLLLKNKNQSLRPPIPGQPIQIPMSTDMTIYDRYFLENEALNAYDQAEALAMAGKPVTLENVTQPEKQQTSNETPSNNATTTTTKGSKKNRLRNIYHPLFANVDYREAEERLRKEGKGSGEIVIRPSSKGFNHLTITWAFAPGTFKHIDIEEKGKTNPNDIGRELYIRESDDSVSEPYADLDEIYSRYIEPMNDYVSIMIKSKYFFTGSPEEVEEQMKRDIDRNPTRIPYYIRYEKSKPGFFMLTWMSLNANSTQPVKKELIAVRPNGYRMKGRTFSHPGEVINFFKQATTAAINSSQNQQSNTSHINQQQAKPRRSRFEPVGTTYPPQSSSSTTAAAAMPQTYYAPPLPSQGMARY